MQNRQRIGFLLIIVVLLISGVFLIQTLPKNDGSQSDMSALEANVIQPHPYNNLDWWDIAWDLAKPAEFQFTLSSIISVGPRWTRTPGFYRAGDFLIEHLGLMGLNVSYWGEHDSVVAYQKGYGDDNRALVFGAHLDSEEDQTGVDQNAAGCAIVSMIAGTLSQFRLPIDIYYCFFSGNMMWFSYYDWKITRCLYGANEVSEQLKQDGVDVMCLLNFDEVLFYDPGQDEDERITIEHHSPSSVGYHQSLYLAELLEAFMKKSGSDIVTPVLNTFTDACHTKFWERNMPAIHITSGHAYRTEDYEDDSVLNPNFNFEQAMLLGRAASAFGVYMALQGNAEISRIRIVGEFSALETRQCDIVMSVDQEPVVWGPECETNLSIEIRNSTNLLLSRTILNGTSFSFECDRPAGTGPLSISVTNLVNESGCIQVNLDYASDTDGNQILDSDQYTWSEPDPPLDWDKDGLSDIIEHEIGTDIFVRDTDSDGAIDSIEYAFELDPLRDDMSEDKDGDGLSNLRELTLGTHPARIDSDQDTLPDIWEVTFGTNPLVNDTALDDDGDSLTNLEEYLNGADPKRADGDFDGLSDSYEIKIGTNPLNKDSDNDGLADNLEILEGLDPLFPDFDVDLAPDGPDHNPRINTLIVIGLFASVPVGLGTIFLWRRLGRPIIHTKNKS